MLRIILILFGITAIVVGVLGLRGQTSSNRPWHVFLDMKYQARYSAQGQSPFFADGRSSRPPVAGTIPYDGGVTRTDAGDHGDANPDFLPDTDPVYFKGRIKPDEKRMVDNREETVSFFVEHIPRRAVDAAVFADSTRGYRGWDALMRRGRERYTINCAVCHGDSGYGGQGETAHGMVGRGIIDPVTGKRNPGMIGIASYHVDRLREAPDGYLFDVIANGKNTMSAYGHQVEPQDRWAIVAYIRALQLSQNAPVTLGDPLPPPREVGEKGGAK